jgi:uncharacterized protein DUF3224
MPHATGEFTVKLIPKTQPLDSGAEANANKPARAIPLFSLMTNDKEWSGDLVATSMGEMISASTAVPDSGTDELPGITGTLTLRVEAGKHFYDLEYEVATAAK